MAFTRLKTIDGNDYWYLVIAYRIGGRGRQAQCYLGPASMTKKELAVAKDRKQPELCRRVDREKKGRKAKKK